MSPNSAHRARAGLLLVFTLSGFAGLIYESIWSHYLKLMLGHAAQAQILVLVLFMGGMALGAGICGRYSARLRQPLLVYALVELVLGLFALSFDPVFRGVHSWLLESAAPALATPWLIEILKWTLAGALILPACVLLGATFPLISAGVLRIDPASAGNALGWLYFTNSLGAVAGVLTSGFVLIGLVGLPGTLMTAGLCNFLLALVVYGINKGVETPPLHIAAVQISGANSDQASKSLPPGIAPLLVTAFLTGAASFLYEIGWIRMLSLVLGSATHSFELMLGAFILGLALGALWIRNRIDNVRNPLRLLAWVQVLMAAAALCSLVVYGWSFHWMSAIVETLAKTDTGYVAFTLLSQAICWALMLPVTFFAGMTLPLITVLVLRGAAGETAIGRVYAANTWGAIVGIVIAVNLAMPLLGLRNVVVLGAGIDLLLGLWLFSRAGMPERLPARWALAAVGLLALGIASFVRFDPLLLASGVFRHGGIARDGITAWHRDGKTATVDVTYNSQTEHTSIITNGKPDASLSEKNVSQDDYTQIALAGIPIILRPDAKSVAVIGMGSGRSTHVFLGSSALEEVHTIEIEPAMVEGARLFGPLVDRTFNDPRSHIHIEDAKTFFARHQRQYDIIMSEPSNPWVSGVASLFSQEFYRQVRSRLAEGGLFAQWLQLYEFDDQLAASVLKALSAEFSDYVVYLLDEGDLLIVAVANGEVPRATEEALSFHQLQPLLSSIGIRNLDEVNLRLLADKSLVELYTNSFSVPPNSDYFPFLDQNAAEYRFKRTMAKGLIGAHAVTHRLLNSGDPIDYPEVSMAPYVPPTVGVFDGFQFWAYLDWKHREDERGDSPVHDAEVLEMAIRSEVVLGRCDPDEVRLIWMPTMLTVGELWWPYMSQQQAGEVISILRGHACKGEIGEQVSGLLDLMSAVSRRDWRTVADQADAALRRLGSTDTKPAFLVREALLASYIIGGADAVRQKAELIGKPLPADPSIRYLLMAAGLR